LNNPYLLVSQLLVVQRPLLGSRSARLDGPPSRRCFGKMSKFLRPQCMARIQISNKLEYEVIWGHIDNLVIAVRRLSRRWKVKTLIAGPLSPTLPYGNQSPHGPKFGPQL